MPQGIEEATGLLVLNLAHNQISEIAPQTFVNLCDLIHLDLSNNALETLPAQMRRLGNLKVMNLSNNPLGFAQLRQLPSLVALKELYLSNTQAGFQNIKVIRSASGKYFENSKSEQVRTYLKVLKFLLVLLKLSI